MCTCLRNILVFLVMYGLALTASGCAGNSKQFTVNSEVGENFTTYKETLKDGTIVESYYYLTYSLDKEDSTKNYAIFRCRDKVLNCDEGAEELKNLLKKLLINNN